MCFKMLESTGKMCVKRRAVSKRIDGKWGFGNEKKWGGVRDELIARFFLLRKCYIM